MEKDNSNQNIFFVQKAPFPRVGHLRMCKTAKPHFTFMIQNRTYDGAKDTSSRENIDLQMCHNSVN